MRRTVTGITGFLLSVALVGHAQDSPYEAPLDLQAMSVHAFAEDQETAVAALAADEVLPVEVRLKIRDFLPRALEPVLVIDGEAVEARSRVVAVEDDITEIGFLLDDPTVLDPGAEISVQMGNVEDTRSTRARSFSTPMLDLLDAQDVSALGMDVDQRDRTKY